MALTFRKLEVFVAVAELGNFRKAAEQLGISQPSVSSQVKSMERYLGYRLFERRRGATARLSPEGAGFLSRASELVAAQSALNAGRLGMRPHRLHLRVTLGPLMLEKHVKPGLPRFHEAHPHISLEFTGLAARMDGAGPVRRGETDVLVCTGALPVNGDAAMSEVLSRITCSLYGAPALVRPVLQGQRLLAELPFLLLPDEFRFAQWSQAQLASKGIHPVAFAARPPDMAAMLQMVLVGKGLALFFDLEIAAQLRAGRVLPCGPVFDPVARMMITGNRARVPEAAPLLAFLRDAVRRDDEAIATQQLQPLRDGLFAVDDSFARMTGM